MTEILRVPNVSLSYGSICISKTKLLLLYFSPFTFESSFPLSQDDPAQCPSFSFPGLWRPSLHFHIVSVPKMHQLQLQRPRQHKPLQLTFYMSVEDKGVWWNFWECAVELFNHLSFLHYDSSPLQKLNELCTFLIAASLFQLVPSFTAKPSTPPLPPTSISSSFYNFKFPFLKKMHIHHYSPSSRKSDIYTVFLFTEIEP